MGKTFYIHSQWSISHVFSFTTHISHDISKHDSNENGCGVSIFTDSNIVAMDIVLPCDACEICHLNCKHSSGL